MDDANTVNRILGGLLSKTEAKQLMWQRSASADQFMVVVDDVCVLVSCDEIWTRRSTSQFRMRIVDDEGTTVEAIQTSGSGDRRAGVVASDEQAAMLADLYVKARAIALNSQETLLKLAQALEVQ